MFPQYIVVMKQFILYIIVCLGLSVQVNAQNGNFPLPEVPQMLVNPTDRANYVKENMIPYCPLGVIKDKSAEV